MDLSKKRITESGKGKIIWDESKPDGQPQRMFDTAKVYEDEEFGFKTKTCFREGLKRTIG